jgi:LysM repeat protein
LRYRDVAIDVQKFIDLENKTLTPLVSMGQEPVPAETGPRFSEATLLPEGTDTQPKSSDPVVQEPEPPREVWYRIKSGDTLGKIASRKGTTVSALCKMNRITPKTILKIGRSIRVG